MIYIFLYIIIAIIVRSLYKRAPWVDDFDIMSGDASVVGILFPITVPFLCVVITLRTIFHFADVVEDIVVKYIKEKRS